MSRKGKIQKNTACLCFKWAIFEHLIPTVMGFSFINLLHYVLNHYVTLDLRADRWISVPYQQSIMKHGHCLGLYHSPACLSQFVPFFSWFTYAILNISAPCHKSLQHVWRHESSLLHCKMSRCEPEQCALLCTYYTHNITSSDNYWLCLSEVVTLFLFARYSPVHIPVQAESHLCSVTQLSVRNRGGRKGGSFDIPRVIRL